MIKYAFSNNGMLLFIKTFNVSSLIPNETITFIKVFYVNLVIW